jgi:hypothetical protein
MVMEFESKSAIPMGDELSSMGGAMVQSSPSMAGGMPGAPGMGGMGAMPDASAPAELALQENLERFSLPAPADGVADPFAAPPAPAAEPQSPPMLSEVDGDVFAVDPPGEAAWADGRVLGSGGPSKPKKGSARLSVNVNLDIPDDYQAREFVSVADAVHQPSVLSLVVQRRGQIAAIRFLAAMIVILLAWRMRKAATLWKLTIATSLLLMALALLPLVSNAWQSVLDGVVIGCVISAGMALVMGCCSFCTCPLTWFRRWTANF